MPNNASLRRQRALGGAIGVAVLGFALLYHFFPGLFHVDPEAVPHRAMNLGEASARNGSTTPVRVSALGELNAGPPLTLAPAEVIAARRSKAPSLPEQVGEDPPEVQAWLAEAARALHAGRVAGGADSAAGLYAKALAAKPDSRRAAQGLFEVRGRLVAEIDQDILLGDVDAARELLDVLRGLPEAEAEVMQVEASLATLENVRPLLAQAAVALRAGKADQPPHGSALDLYRQALELDPDNAVAEQGVFQVQRAVLDRALAAVAENDFAGAARELATADAIRPGSQQMVDVRRRIDGMRSQRAQGVLAQAHSALDAGNLALATRLAAQARGIEPDLDGLAELEEALTNARLYASYKPGQVFSDNFVDLPGKAPALVVIPTGRFRMGASEDAPERQSAALPQHAVTIAKGFALGRTEVTVAEFREFVRASGYVPDSVRLGGSSVYDERTGALRDDARATWEDDYAGRKAADALPVVNVSWNDAQAYVAWLAERTGRSYRLPSEAEFEYALRAGTTTAYWWGEGTPAHTLENLTGANDRSRNGRRWSNAFRNYRDGYWGPAPVMHFSANPLGLYDIGGNVSEWVADCWHDSYLRAPADGSAWINPGCRIRVLRGGSWGSSPEQVNSAWRQGTAATTRSARVGFRVLREL